MSIVDIVEYLIPIYVCMPKSRTLIGVSWMQVGLTTLKGGATISTTTA